MKKNKLVLISGAVLLLGVLGVLIAACNKDPYMPMGQATYIGQEDNKYGGNNDEQSLLGSIRAMTYNIHACIPPSKPDTVDIGGIVAAIRQGNPDIVFLQEVDKGTNRNGFTHDQAAVLGDSLKMNVAYFSARAYLRGHYGIAILSKYPLYTVRKYELTRENESTEQRVMGTAYVDLPGKDSIMAVVTHLQHNSATNRLQQVNDIVNILGPKNDKIVLGADFNEVESAGTQFYPVFDRNFTRSCAGAGCPLTFPATVPSSTIDFIAYKPVSAFSVQSLNTIPSQASDHLPVLSELRFNR